MPKLNPTLGVRDTAKNTKEFMQTNKDALWRIVKSLAPWIAALYIIDVVVSRLYFPDSENGFVLGELLASYFYTAFVISWHRVAIHGPEHAVMMNPFKPKKHELAFIGIGLLIGFTGIVGGALAGSTLLIHPIIGAVAFFSFLIAFLYVGYKICFYFPAKAVNASITFKESFALTKGYFWKLAGAYALSVLRYILGVILYLIGVALLGFITAILGGESLGENTVAAIILDTVLTLPIVLYFYPLFYAVGVTVLSNYYQHAIQNKS